eukprot:gene6986-6639_t
MRSVEWVGKVWGNSSVPGILSLHTSPRLLSELAHWLDHAPPRVPLRAIQSFLGSAVWASSPSHFALSYFAPIFARVADLPPDSHPCLDIPLPRSARDLAHQGLRLAALGWSGNAPTPIPHPSFDQHLQRLHSRYSFGKFASSRFSMTFVDYSVKHNVCALVHIDTLGQVWVMQWVPTSSARSSVNQQLGEFVALAGGVAHLLDTAPPSCVQPSVLFGDNEGAMAAMYFAAAPSVPGRSYWTRRLAAHIASLGPEADGVSPWLAHVAGDENNPADPYCRGTSRPCMFRVPVDPPWHTCCPITAEIR